jgi:hypothetical protein
MSLIKASNREAICLLFQYNTVVPKLEGDSMNDFSVSIRVSFDELPFTTT